MRYAGRISDWNDDKGYGFVVPHNGGDRAFVHIKSFQFGSRRPINGDLISYATNKDSRGRTNAIDVRFAGQRIEKHNPPLPIPRIGIGIMFLLTIGILTLFGAIPIFFIAGYLLLSGISYLTYRSDKSAAENGAQRTPEATLHFLDLLGGWPGALIAQQQFRHKTVKASFQSVFWLIVFINIATAYWLLHSGLGQSLKFSALWAN